MTITDYRTSDFKESARLKGTKFHAKYRQRYKSWERVLFLYEVERYMEGKVFARKLDNIRVIGCPDDFDVSEEKRVSLIEVYTTAKDIDEKIIAKKELQLQTYIWILEPIIIKTGYKISGQHYLEIYDPNSRELLDRRIVSQRYDIIDVIREKID
jgi:hypothetical protein